jgi:diguanylate cyclase
MSVADALQRWRKPFAGKAMRYTQSKERSAEILRAALALMGQHDAALNPLTFAVWYEHAAGINAKLNRAIDECLRTEPRLGDATIARLYQDHISEPDEQAIQRASGEFERMIAGMADSAARTGVEAGAFGAKLDGLQQALRGNASAELLPVISKALESTAQMKDSTAALQQQVASSRQEIERLRNDLSRARVEALLDSLTGALNRRAFDQKLQEMLDEAPEPGKSHWLVMLDIDRFKAVNDTYGHVMGDRVLQAVGEVLRRCVSDPLHSVARYGGEEFALLLPHSEAALAMALAETCRLAVKALKIRDRRTQSTMLTVTISAGVACHGAGEPAVSLTSRADEALYAAKQAGRDRVVRAADTPALQPSQTPAPLPTPANG